VVDIGRRILGLGDASFRGRARWGGCVVGVRSIVRGLGCPKSGLGSRWGGWGRVGMSWGEEKTAFWYHRAMRDILVIDRG
jgi:hypothetical protein